MLEGVRVVDLSTGIAGPYCTKLLADAGADVVKVEPPEGDPLRRWVSSGAEIGEEDGALFSFLNASKRSVLGDLGSPEVQKLAATADILVESSEPGVVESRELHRLNPALVVVSLSAFGHDGPWAGRPATEFTLQAWCGSIASRGRPDEPPLAAGGRIGEWVGGSFAAPAALAALRRARDTGKGDHVDVSLLECMTLTMNTYAYIFGSFLNFRRAPGPARSIEMPSIEPTRDGYVGFCTITAQQFQDFLLLIQRPDLIGDKGLAQAGTRMKRMDEFLGIIHEWTSKHTTAEIIEGATALRIPVALIGNGRSLLEMDHFAERKTFVAHPGRGFVQPRVPYRISGTEPWRPGRAPKLGEHSGSAAWRSPATSGTLEARGAGRGDAGGGRPGGRDAERQPGAREAGRQAGAQEAERQAGTGAAGDKRAVRDAGERPLSGIRILDFTAFWAGPAGTNMLATLGADVIKVESVQRPDGMRFTSTAPPSADRWWEWGPVFHGANTNKRSVTLDLGRRQGLDLAKKLIEKSDAVMENFTPRVMEGFGLDWPTVHQVNPRAVMVRMPGFGLSGPWRDRTGFAQTMEQVSGMAWVTGWPDGPPLIPRGVCDPMAGVHAAFSLLVALEEVRTTGEGRLVEMTMVEVALNAAAAQVVEQTAYGRLEGRHGNRGPGAAPQGLYACRGEEQWLALAVETDEQWGSLRRVLGEPHWAASAELSTLPGRRERHDMIDAELSAWASSRDLHETVDQLWSAGVPAAAAVPPVDVYENTQLKARGLLETVEHPVTGAHPMPGMPFRPSGPDQRWIYRPAPTLGQHNAEVLGGLLGLSAQDLDRLEADSVIGTRPLGV